MSRKAWGLLILGGAATAVLFALVRTHVADPGPEDVRLAELPPVAAMPPSLEVPSELLADPEALAQWFQDRVSAELARLEEESARAGRRDGRGPDPRADEASEVSAGPPPRRGERAEEQAPVRIPPQVPAPLREAAAASGLPAETLAAVDWDYVGAVFSGRISGIPNETKAGLPLSDLERLGDVPALEELRAEGDHATLIALGVEESVPWPACLRTGTCRRDPVSSP